MLGRENTGLLADGFGGLSPLRSSTIHTHQSRKFQPDQSMEAANNAAYYSCEMLKKQHPQFHECFKVALRRSAGNGHASAGAWPTLSALAGRRWGCHPLRLHCDRWNFSNSSTLTTPQPLVPCVSSARMTGRTSSDESPTRIKLIVGASRTRKPSIFLEER
jgi:hypothetical protein